MTRFFADSGFRNDARSGTVSVALVLLLIVPGTMVFAGPLFAEDSTPLEQGISFYEDRHRDAGETVADPAPVNRAIERLRGVLEASPSPEEERKAASYLLRSYYFKGTYVPHSQQEKESIFAKGKELGNRMLEKYPESVPIRYGYVINLSRWGEVYGIMAAAREGVAGQIRRHCKKMIELDPDYKDAAPYRILGLVHHKAPYIPFVLSWPSTDRALEYLGEAVDRAPEEPSNRYHYASVLAEVGRTEEALEQLEQLRGDSARPSSVVEDRRILERAEELQSRLSNS